MREPNLVGIKPRHVLTVLWGMWLNLAELQSLICKVGITFTFLKCLKA